MARSGYIASTSRKSQPAQLKEEFTPAPWKGWNTRDQKTMMDPTYAVSIVNFTAEPDGIRLRDGCKQWATGLGARVQTLLPYRGTAGTGGKFFAATSAGNIYNITAPGAVSAAVQTGLSNGQLQYVNFQGAAGQFLVVVNGIDAARHYDGTNWVTWTTVATPAAPGQTSGIATTKLKSVISHQRRLWFTEANSSRAWYSPVEQLGGALSSIDFGPYFPRGGSLHSLASWSMDGGKGTQNYLIGVSEYGDCAIYEGSDVSVSTNWTLTGTWTVSAPVGQRCWKQKGADLLMLCADGLVNFSKYFQSSLITATLTDTIRKTITDVVSISGTLYGFQIHEVHARSLVVLNIPSLDPLYNTQYIYNTQTHGWSAFTGWNAECWEGYGTSTYFGGSDGVVYLAFSGLYSDKVMLDGTGGSTYKARAQSAFNYFDSQIPARRSIRKLFKFAKLGIVSSSALPAIRVGIAVVPGISSSIVTASAASAPTLASLWDTGAWDKALWQSELFSFETWQAISGVGYCASILVEVTSQADTLWTTVGYRYVPAVQPGV